MLGQSFGGTARRSSRRPFKHTLNPCLESLERRDVPTAIVVGDPGTRIGDNTYSVASTEDTYIGAMERADDVDLFAVYLRPGQRFSVTVTDSWNQNDRKDGLWPHVIIWGTDLRILAQGYHQNFTSSFTVAPNQRIRYEGIHYVSISARGNDRYEIGTGSGTRIPTFHSTSTGQYELKFDVEGGIIPTEPTPTPPSEPEPTPVPIPQPEPTPIPPTPTPVPLPDLVASNFQFSYKSPNKGVIANDMISVGSEFDVSFDLANQSSQLTGFFYVNVYVSTDSKIEPDSDFTYSSLIVPILDGLDAYEHRSVSATLTLPLALSPRVYHGKVWLGVAVDPTNMIAESNESNNWNVSGVSDSSQVRQVRLFDPVVSKHYPGVTSWYSFEDASQAITWLNRNGFWKIPFPFDNRRSFSRRTSDVRTSYFNGVDLPGKFFRVEAVLRWVRGRYRITAFHGADSTFNPSGGSPSLGEPSPEAVKPTFRRELGGNAAWINWVFYVKEWHSIN